MNTAGYHTGNRPQRLPLVLQSQNIEGSNQAESTQTSALSTQGAGNEKTITTEQADAVQEIGRLHNDLREATRVSASTAYLSGTGRRRRLSGPSQA